MAASSEVSAPTSRSGLPGRLSESRIGPRSPGPILHAHPAPWESSVRRGDEPMAATRPGYSRVWCVMGGFSPESSMSRRRSGRRRLMVEPAIAARLRSLPSVEEVVGGDEPGPHARAVAAARGAIGALRARILAGESIDAGVEAVREEVRARLAAARRPSLRTVTDATGGIV